METLETLSERLETTGDIRGIVRTMKALSAVSIHQYEQAVAALSAYRRGVELGLQAILRERAAEAGAAAPAGRSAVIAIGSDRGLCGRFNEAIAEHARAQLLVPEPDRRQRPLLMVAGVRLAARLTALGHRPDREIALPGSVNGLVRSAQAMIVQADAWRTDHGVGEVHLCHNHRAGASRVAQRSTRLLPLDPAELLRLASAEWPARGLPMHRMAREPLHAHLVRERIYLDLFRALAESLASEHAARLAAMQAAERNIETREQELSAAYRQKRQETITTELLDIVAGFEAMRDDGESEDAAHD